MYAMVNKWGIKSKKELDTLHVDLVIICNDVLKTINISVIEGWRGKDLQDFYYKAGKSKVNFPNGKHNKVDLKGEPESMAVHLMVWFKFKPHIDWTAIKQMYFLAGYVIATAEKLYKKSTINHLIRWGGDWDKDFDVREKQWDDLTHFELYSPSPQDIERIHGYVPE